MVALDDRLCRECEYLAGGRATDELFMSFAKFANCSAVINHRAWTGVVCLERFNMTWRDSPVNTGKHMYKLQTLTHVQVEKNR